MERPDFLCLFVLLLSAYAHSLPVHSESTSRDISDDGSRASLFHEQVNHSRKCGKRFVLLTNFDATS